jgi:hypothetical protein
VYIDIGFSVQITLHFFRNNPVVKNACFGQVISYKAKLQLSRAVWYGNYGMALCCIVVSV